MRKKPSEIKDKLMSIIREMSATPWLFAKEAGKDFSRKRKLPFERLVLLLLGMGGGSLRSQLLTSTGYSADTVSASAFVQQRSKLLPLALEYILHSFVPKPGEIKRYKGLRLLATDGSHLHTPTNPHEADSFIQTAPGAKGYNLLHLNALYDLCNGIYLDAVLQSCQQANEHAALTAMIDRSRLSERALLIADRGYEAYNNLAHIERKGWFFLIRVKEAHSNGILRGTSLPDTPVFDVPIHRILTRKQTKEVKANLDLYKVLPKSSTFDFCDLHENRFYPITFRAVRFMLPNGSFETVVTNLPADAFPPRALLTLYNLRWGIETSFRSLKYAVGMTRFHSKKTECITQEVFAAMIMYNFAAMITSHAFTPRKTARFVYQVNFSLAVQISRAFLLWRDAHPPDVEALIRNSALPIRPGRSFPRNVRYRQAVSFLYRLP